MSSSEGRSVDVAVGDAATSGGKAVDIAVGNAATFEADCRQHRRRRRNY